MTARNKGKQSSRVKKVRKPKENVYAHGATKPVVIREADTEWEFEGISFGATIGFIPDYPVSFYGVNEIKKLRDFIDEAIKYLESRKK